MARAPGNYHPAGGRPPSPPCKDAAMTFPGPLPLVCASAFVAADPAGAPAANDPTDKTVTTVLAVQSALQEGREHLLHGEHRAAVSVLECQLPYINGNKVYLKALEDAYRGYIKEL